MSQETQIQEAQREVSHWRTVVAKYSGKTNPLDKIMVEDATALLEEWTAKLERLTKDGKISMIAELLWNSDGAPTMSDEDYAAKYVEDAKSQYADFEAGQLDPWWAE